MAGSLYKLLKPIAKKVIHNPVRPIGPARALYDGVYQLVWLGREVSEWATRSLIATPAFLSQCAVYGDRITADQVPYISGPVRIELGSDIRISGLISIQPASHRPTPPLLKIGNGCFIGHHTALSIGNRIELGDYVSIGHGSFISDTEGHARTEAKDRPAWETPSAEGDTSEVIIEDHVWIARNCMILKGVRIGARSILGSGSVVRSDIPPDSVVMGNPARVVKRLERPASAAAH
ncbi:MAG: acyltransferase [Polyangiaceae bacterium]|nr:acyltransferase [Polyangiaceae bacterium]